MRKRGREDTGKGGEKEESGREELRKEEGGMEGKREEERERKEGRKEKHHHFLHLLKMDVRTK